MATTTARVTPGTHNPSISAQTVRNRLREAGLRACRPVVGQVLTRHHWQQRRQWAQTHRRWTRQDWQNVLFTDKLWFCLTRGDGRFCVYHRRNERYTEACTLERDRFGGGGSVMVWGGVTAYIILCVWTAGSGDSSMEREFTGALGGPTVSTPNSQHTSPSRSLSANSIKVELYSDEEPGRGTGPEDERGDRVEEGGSEQGGEAGGGGYRELASPEPMSPGGAIRLPNGKLKCDICGMICIGPNVLMVHKRSHTGERPFQCNQCGASFTQKGNLLRHIKLHSGEKPFKCPFCSYACRRRDALTGHLRTHSVSSPTVGKPYKCSYCGRSYKQQSTLEEHRERCHSYLQSLETQQPASAHTQGKELRDLEFMPDNLLQPSSDKMAFIDRLAHSITKRKRSTPQKFVGKHLIGICLWGGDLGGGHLGGQGGGSGGGSEGLRPLRLPLPHPSCLSELRPVISSAHTPMATLGPREAAEGHEDLPPGRSHGPSPSNGCQDSTDTESMDGERDREEGGSPTSRQAFRVVDGEGHTVRSFRCEHCRVLFLDHVMFTIHMGCHGFRQPFECNICGHRSQDRYEFSSHIVRGEHLPG
uniref:IKAROS family zinc finger 4 n=1 Tax=Hucho hucho TaxID=62062 RepID=A0A4W5NT11_9TELE